MEAAQESIELVLPWCKTKFTMMIRQCGESKDEILPPGWQRCFGMLIRHACGKHAGKVQASRLTSLGTI